MTVFGSSDELVARGVRQALPFIESFVAALRRSVDGQRATEEGVLRGLALAAREFHEDLFAAAVMRAGLQGAMLGVLDADHEMTAPVALDAGRTVATFVTKPFEEALQFFGSKRIVSPSAFDRLSKAQKLKAFTVARLSKRAMLVTAHEELLDALRDGATLDNFSARLGKRFDSAGWSRLNPSHVEVVFRNGVLGSYGDGRYTQQTLPEVLAARPFWQVLGVDDDRSRSTHKAAHRKYLPASDAFWQRAYPPFGHNCRCRVVARRATDVESRGLDRIDPSVQAALPDKGWASKRPALPAAPPPPPAAPKGARVGVHVHSAAGGTVVDDARMRQLLEGVTHPRMLGALEKLPLPRLVVSTDDSRGMTDANGVWWPHKMYIRSERHPGSWGQPKTPGLWSISSAGATADEARQRTFTHEVGHQVHLSLKLRTRQEDAVMAAWKRHKRSGVPAVTRYAATNRNEYFAESFAAYVHEPELLRARDPNAYNLVEEVLGEVERLPP